jgi:hypothetical protein
MFAWLQLSRHAAGTATARAACEEVITSCCGVLAPILLSDPHLLPLIRTFCRLRC